jgi:tyrosinase
MVKLHHIVRLFLCATAFLFEENVVVTAQSCGVTRERWAWTDYYCGEQDEFIQAVFDLKRDGTYDEFVRVHRDTHSRAHGLAEFLPWHRWFIYKFEDALREVSGNPCLTIPYWDWEDSSVFDDDTFSWFEDSYEGSDLCKWQTLTGCLRRDMDQSISMWRSGQILAMIMNYDQYGDEFSRDPQRNNGLRAALEGGPHTAPHAFLGGPMLETISASDPLFFVHHANVDRIWSLWQDYHDHDQVDISQYNTPEHYEGVLMDVPMSFSRSRLFQMENGNYPTPRDVLSNSNIVNVLYKNDQLARRLRYIPNPAWIESAPQGSEAVWCDRTLVRQDLENRDLQIGKRLDNQYTLESTKTEIEAFREEEKTELNNSSSVSTSSLDGSNIERPEPSRKGKRFDARHALKTMEIKTEEFREEEGTEFNISPLAFTSSLRGSNIERSELSKSSVFVSVDRCLNLNDFIDEDEHRIWDKHCQELPLTLSLAERMASLAQEECREQNNQISVSSEIIKAMHMNSELAAFECFHLPDQHV